MFVKLGENSMKTCFTAKLFEFSYILTRNTVFDAYIFKVPRTS